MAGGRNQTFRQDAEAQDISEYGSQTTLGLGYVDLRVIFGLSWFTDSLKSCCKNEPYVQHNNQMISRQLRSYGDDSYTLSFDNQDRDT